METLAIASALFVASHIGLSSTSLRGLLVSAIGEKPFKGLFSVISLGALVWMVMAYDAPSSPLLWEPPEILAYLPLVAMPLALILLAAGVSTSNPTSLGQEKVLTRKTPARGIVRVTRHPIQWAILLWSGSHILANGDQGSLLFFGGFFLLALTGPFLIDRKRKATLGADWEAFAAATSNVPFAAILTGRNSLKLGEIGWLRIAVGLLLYAGFILAHPWMFGVTAY
jgi:uncharacterized membrane protein